jgi:DNA-binding PadR family transcriptional regulator
VVLRGRGQGRGRGGRHRRQRGRSRRSIRLLEPALLFLLHSGPNHGYSLLDRLNEFGLENLNPSVVYRALREMEAQGWVQSKWEGEETQGPPRRIYELTIHGVEMLTVWAKDLEESRGRIDRLLQTYKRDLDDG